MYIPNQNCQRDEKIYLYLSQRKMQHKKKYSLSKIMTERVLFHNFRTGRRILCAPNLNNRLLFLIMIFCFTLTIQNNGKLHEEPTNQLCCAKNELTIGLVYTE